MVSFAVHWVRAEIHEYILRNWRIVKVATTKAQRKLFFKLRGAKKRLGWLNREEVDAVAGELGVGPDVVMEMEQRLHARDAAFDGQADGDSEPERPAPAAYLEDTSFEPSALAEREEWDAQASKHLHGALAKLDDRSREIITKRWLGDEKVTLQELGDKYRISAERVRQLENNAMAKLRGVLDVS